MNLRLHSAAVLILLAFPIQANAQCDDPGAEISGWNFDPAADQGFSVGRFLRESFTPQVVTEVRQLRDYIRDPRFVAQRAKCGDIRTVDAIYMRCLIMADYEIVRGLFLSLMCVLEHQNVNVKIPVFESFSVPLTFEEDSLFKARISHLPDRLYTDTPPAGDRDKLQHFFASAYLTYMSESPDLARVSGNFVEWGEARFIVGGADDERDKRANKQGEAFGRDLLLVKNLLPSDYIVSPGEGR